MSPAIWDVERAKRDEEIARAGLLREVYSHRRQRPSGSSLVPALRLKLGAILVRAGYALAGSSAAGLGRAPDVRAGTQTLSR
jgi:hypothetical protein